jgi:hypothetical protein
MEAFKYAIVGLWLVFCLVGVSGITHMRYDSQYSWTRNGWSEAQLPLYVNDALASALSKQIDTDETLLTSSMLGVLAGPDWVQALQHNGMQQSARLSALEMIHTANASELLHCELCNYLAQDLWHQAVALYHKQWTSQRSAEWINTLLAQFAPGSGVLTKPGQPSSVCNEHWMNVWLHRMTLQRVELPARSAAASASIRGEEYALCTRVARDKVSDAEVTAATLACKV